MIGVDDLKLYCLNITSFTIASMDWLEPALKIILLLVTIGYTGHKWWKLKKEEKQKEKEQLKPDRDWETYRN